MGKRYDRAAIERALDIHRDARRIRAWHTDEFGWYIVELNTMANPPNIELRTAREAYVFVAGLASAHYTPAPEPVVEQTRPIGPPTSHSLAHLFHRKNPLGGNSDADRT